jgi:amidase
VQHIGRNEFATNYSVDNKPRLRVSLGEQFYVHTADRLAEYEGSHSDDILKSMTGPVYVEGIEPGDSIRVEITDIHLPFDRGWIITTGRGPLKDRVPALLKRRVAITEHGVVFNDTITLPLRPMISRVGVAPESGHKASIAKGEFGGAMGNTQITKGSTVFLPVYHKGALLTFGDGHAAQGDGEVSASAVECAVDIVVKVTREERFNVTRPLITTLTHAMTSGEGETMEAAVHAAVLAMVELLMQQLKVTEVDAAMLISTSADVRFGLAGYPPYTITVVIPRSVLPL